MGEANDVHGSVFKNGTFTAMARLTGHDGAQLMQADFTIGSSSSSSECGPALSYSIYLLDDQDSDSRTDVTGHTDETLAAEDVIFDTLQDDEAWDLDDTGYNFRHVIPICEYPAFEIAGRRYLVEYTLWPREGQAIILRYFLNCK